MWLRDRAGTEPATARSPTRARKILSAIALPVALAAAIFFTVQAMSSGREVWWWEAAIAYAVALFAAVDLVVLLRRSRR
ncbi:DUF6343 family protein [Nonomuraea africana]|uniref:Membrane protein YdbS with pleckstrin-like domain n=1 Tax=Nonomuraea africana TaxID=46171 RepID=A0ABR9KWY3_9ACTN|nr:DUF6343 family protein [Nonomuraea africana]MBE1566113.1 membrane protein YdbS with pleckstrin-like domain [Nonomuraea africana]